LILKGEEEKQKRDGLEKEVLAQELFVQWTGTLTNTNSEQSNTAAA
jgi:hypothetical protein